MNIVMLKGRLTRDADVRYSQGDKPTAVAKFSLAVQRMKKDDGADFINCTAFGKTAETIEKYVFKGNEIIVVGHWQTGNYTDKNGNKVYTNDCIVDRIEFCGSKSDNGNTYSGPVGTPQSAPEDASSFMNVPADADEELPFN